MHKFKIAAIALLFGAAVTPALAQDTMSAEQCQAMLAKADKNGDGSLNKGEMEPFAEKMAGANVKPKDNTLITNAEFMQNCETGMFKDVMVQ